MKRIFDIRLTVILSLFVAALGLNADQKKPPDTVILKGNPMGGVKFDHKAHMERAKGKCDTCHHPSKPQKPMASPQESCFECHTKLPSSAVKVTRRAAFHNAAATAGTCIDCHKAENAKGMKAPTKCMECHKKTNT